MSRVIKLRMWNPASNSYLYDVENVYECLKQQIIFEGSQPTRGFTKGYDHKSEGMIWEEFTGLQDKNGKDIYEGDILNAGDRLVKVVWHKHLAQFDTDFITYFAERTSNGLLNSEWIFRAVVEGNINEN